MFRSLPLWFDASVKRVWREKMMLPVPIPHIISPKTGTYTFRCLLSAISNHTQDSSGKMYYNSSFYFFYLVTTGATFGSYLYWVLNLADVSCLEASDDVNVNIASEKIESNSSSTTMQKEEDDLDDKEDWIDTDWSDLPPDDQDKETSCFICLVNREGPCRNYWRRFEKCMDDNPGEDEEGNSLSTKACEKPFIAWMRCQQKHHEYYRERAEKVEYQLWTDDVKDLEDNREHKPFPNNMSPTVKIDDTDSDGSFSGYAVIPMETNEDHSLVIGYVKNQRGELLGFGSRKKLLEEEVEGRIDFVIDLEDENISIHAVYEGDDAPMFSYNYQLSTQQ